MFKGCDTLAENHTLSELTSTMLNYILGISTWDDPEVRYELMCDIDYELYWDSVPMFARDPGNKYDFVLFFSIYYFCCWISS